MSGEVMVPQALVYIPDDGPEDYIARVGGFTERADARSLMIKRRNGEVVQRDLEDGASAIEVREGDEIVVVPAVPVKNLQIAYHACRGTLPIGRYYLHRSQAELGTGVDPYSSIR